MKKQKFLKNFNSGLWRLVSSNDSEIENFTEMNLILEEEISDRCNNKKIFITYNNNTIEVIIKSFKCCGDRVILFTNSNNVYILEKN